MSPRAILAIVTVFFIGVLGYGYVTMHKPAVATPSTTTTQTDTTQPDTSNTGSTGSPGSTQTGNSAAGSGQTGGTQPSSFTMAQVKTHDSASSCWTTINGKVYDLTQWINQHPGGPGPILSLCGTDGTAAFTAQHGGQGRPETELKSLYIGALVQ